METKYCHSCKRGTGFKRALGWGTFFACCSTLGFWILLIPFYPKRCVICGTGFGGDQISNPTNSTPNNPTRNQVNTPAKHDSEHVREEKKCPLCAEMIKFEAIKCRFCGHDFDPAIIEAEVKERKKDAEKAMADYVSQEGIQGEAFCMGCRTTGPRSSMLFNKKLDAFYHMGCIPK